MRNSIRYKTGNNEKAIKSLFSAISSNVLSLIIVGTLFSGCKKFIEVPPPDTNVTRESAFKADATAISAITSVYTGLSNEHFGSVSFTNISSWIAALSSDEYSLWSGVGNTTPLGYYRNDLSASANI